MDTPSTRAFGAVALVVALVAVGLLGFTLAGPVGGPNASGATVPGSPDEPVDAGTGGSDAGSGWSPTRTPVSNLPEMADSITISESPEAVNVTGLNRTEVTVVTTQGYYPKDEVADLVAFTNEGDVIYHEAKYGVYFDVDPVPGTTFTVEYLASKHFNGTSECNVVAANKCTRDVVRQVNLTTGESRTVFSEITPRFYSARQHDADRLNETHLVVGDIVRNRVFILNTETKEVVWEWKAEYDYSEESGGKWFDWTHLNDVEVLPDGRIMASLRNQDQVVFLDPSQPGREALQEEWTLGEDDDLSILHKQHNPDYIPESRGGPAVLVADSENNRVVEYRRVDGDWERSWAWSKKSLAWPRDADRLPNGNTVVVNTRGDKIYGVGPDDRVVWTVDIGMPYDVERLGSGDESAGGMAADQRGESAAGAIVPGGAGPAGSEPVELPEWFDGKTLLGGSGAAVLVLALALFGRRSVRSGVLSAFDLP